MPFQSVMGAVHAREAFPSDGRTARDADPDAQIPLDNIKAKVVSVSIDGLNRTKNDIIMESVKDLFKVRLCVFNCSTLNFALKILILKR